MRNFKHRVCAVALSIVMAASSLAQSNAMFATNQNDSASNAVSEDELLQEQISPETNPAEESTTKPALEEDTQKAVRAQTLETEADLSNQQQASQTLEQQQVQAQAAEMSVVLEYQKPDISGFTNQDVTVSFGVRSENTAITEVSIDGENVFSGSTNSFVGAKTFSKNGSATIAVLDSNGQTTNFTLNVDQIDRIAPLVSELPSGVVTANSFNQVAFEDSSVEGSSVSGVNLESRKLYIYETEDATQELYIWNWFEIAEKFATLPEGTYYVNASAADLAANIGFAYGSGVAKPAITKDAAANAGALKPTPRMDFTFVETGRTPTGWTNQSVFVDLEAKSDTGIFGIYRDAVPLPTTGTTTMTTSVEFTENGQAHFTSVDSNYVFKAIDVLVDNIDRVSPVIYWLPSNGEITASRFDSVAFLDSGDPSWGASGINDSTKTLYIYDSNALGAQPIHTVNWADIGTVLPTLTSGTYYLDASVEDNATNKTFVNNGPGPAVIITGIPKIEIVETSRSHTTWTNASQVTVDYKVTSKYKLQDIWVDGVLIAEFSSDVYTYSGTLTYPNNGTKTVTAVDWQGNDVSVDFDVTVLDRVAPSIHNLPSGGDVTSTTLAAITFTDDGDAGWAASQINGDTKTLYIYDDNAPGAVPIHTIPWDQIDATIASLPGGTYYLDVSVEDNATNKTFAYNGPGPAVDINYQSEILIVETSRSHTTWTNVPSMTVDYKVESAAKIKEIKVDGVVIYSISGAGINDFIDTLTFLTNGTQTIVVEDVRGETSSLNVLVKILDRVAPSITGLPQSGVVEANDLNAVQFDDAGDAGWNPSEVDMSSRELFIFDSSTATVPVYQWSWTDIAANWSSIPSGKYYLDAAVKDNAGNITYANGGNSATPGGEVEINPRTGDLSIVETSRNTYTWTKKPVTVTYDVRTDVAITEVKVNGKVVYTNTGSDAETYTGTLEFIHNGEYKVYAKNQLGTEQEVTITVDYIDRIFPEISNVPNTGTVTAQDFLNVVFDDVARDNNAASGINQSTRKLYLFDSPTATKEVYKISWNDIPTMWSKIKPGTYWFDISVFDNATNATWINGGCGTPGVGVEINMDLVGLTLKETGRSSTDFTKKSVTVDFSVVSNTALTNVSVIPGATLHYDQNGAQGVKTFSAQRSFFENGDFELYAKNTAGEIERHIITIDTIDRQVPKITGMPTGGELTLEALLAVTFSDEAENGSVASGVNQATRKLYIYDSPTATKEKYKWDWDSIAANFAKLPKGTYYLDASVFDNVTNLGYANGTVGTPGPAVTIS